MASFGAGAAGISIKIIALIWLSVALVTRSPTDVDDHTSAVHVDRGTTFR